MYICVICRSPTEFDDAELVRGREGKCVCARCWYRETGNTLPTDKQLYIWVDAVLKGIGAWITS